MIQRLAAWRQRYAAAFARQAWGHSLLVAALIVAAMRLSGWMIPLTPPGGYSRAVYDRDGRLLRLTLTADQMRRLPFDEARVSSPMRAAILLQEDRWFYLHPGLNPVALLRAARAYLRGSDSGGASTITMQAARLRYGLRTRSPGGKALQIFIALWIELRYSKDAILSYYLSQAPFGGNIEGIEAASLIYFQKPASQLSLPEALLLAVIPKSPERRAPGQQQNEELRRARDALQERWLQSRPGDALAAVALSPGQVHRTSPPFRAPHWTWLALAQSNATQVHTTLDLSIQTIVEEQARLHLQLIRPQGVRNVSAILVDLRSAEILAWLGSAGYKDDSIQGQVDGVRARRSPGSTLKPFLFALAFQQGIIHPYTLLKDAPASYGLFVPENFDRDFSGPLSATAALIRSRNIPAFYLASRVHNPSLYDLLQRSGVGEMKPPSFYQLAIALGGAEVTMEELARLYVALGRGGEMQPLRSCLRNCGSLDAWRGASQRLFSEQAAFLTLDILRQASRPNRGLTPGLSEQSPVYWKTGTSMGFRDAWSAGIFDDYVVIVWSGSFDGSSNPYLSGREAAAPLMFRIIDAMRSRPGHRRGHPAAANPPAGVAQVEVCTVSGDLPNDHCPHRRLTWFLPGVSPIARCNIHREALVDARSGKRVCGARQHVRSEVYEFWPSDLEELFAQAGAPRAAPPEFEAECLFASQEGAPPHITSPLRGASQQLHGSLRDRRMALSAVADGGVRRLYWFADDAYLGAAAPGESFFWDAPTGDFTLRVVDDHGRSDSMPLVVLPPQLSP
ncbi:MAG: penicillin-binding protein 1C [Leptospirales bacterium]|nr:penicillin-binding protein 1C [Leptospirales bacterium]